MTQFIQSFQIIWKMCINVFKMDYVYYFNYCIRLIYNKEPILYAYYEIKRNLQIRRISKHWSKIKSEYFSFPRELK